MAWVSICWGNHCAERPVAPDWSSCTLAPLAAACLAVVLAGVCLVGTGLIGPAAGRSIRVHNYGGLDWDRPVFGQFGAFSGGMFGLLPVYCRAEGYEFDVIEHTQEIRRPDTARSPNGPKAAPTRADAGSSKNEAQGPSAASRARQSVRGVQPARAANGRRSDRRGAAARPLRRGSTGRPPAKTVLRYTDAIEPADLAKTQILVLINSPKEWNDADRRVVLDFVARGGSLLVLGDHTDVFGLMRGFNSLLGPLGIKFRFDSAYKARETLARLSGRGA